MSFLLKILEWIKALLTSKKVEEVDPNPNWVPSWEANHPERAEWSKKLEDLIGGEFFSIFDSAPDVEKVHPEYKSMSKKYKLRVWKEFFSSLAYYECGWNHESVEKDVGHEGDFNTYSIGLFQLSQTDQANLGIRLGYTWQDLKDPLKNINLGVRILANQIVKRKKIFIRQGETGNPGLYWATLHPGGKYDETAKIQARVAKVPYPKKTTEAPKAIDSTPWMTVAEKEIGQKEINGGLHNPRILLYHAATTLHATTDEVPWCSSFVTWVLETAGYRSTKDAWARSYLNCGEKLLAPKYGCIVIFSRGTDSGHVGFYCGEEGDSIRVLGGNQGDEVCKALYPKSKVLGYRWPVKKG